MGSRKSEKISEGLSVRSAGSLKSQMITGRIETFS